MIRLSRLNGAVIAINPDLITSIEVTPDTTIEFLNGDRIMVRESLDEVMDAVLTLRRSQRTPFADSDAHPPSKRVLDAIQERAERLSDRAPRRPSTVPIPRRGGY